VDNKFVTDCEMLEGFLQYILDIFRPALLLQLFNYSFREHVQKLRALLATKTT
jgi:hypothetical protein